MATRQQSSKRPPKGKGSSEKTPKEPTKTASAKSAKQSSGFYTLDGLADVLKDLRDGPIVPGG